MSLVGDDHGAPIAPALARTIVAVAFCAFAGVALLWVLYSGKGVGEFAAAVGCLVALLGLQYVYFCRPSTNLHSRLSYAMLAAQAALAYLPLPFFGQAWVSQPSFLAGSVLLVLPPVAAWPVFAGVVAGTGFAQYGVSGSWLDVGFILVNTTTAGLYVYGLTRLARVVVMLHDARDELAKTAVARERLRFARDLHDLLERNLSAVIPRGELAVRLTRGDPGRAAQELTGILEITHRALADIRAIARLYQEISLDAEPAPLTSMLAAAGVELRVDLDLSELPRHTKIALSAVLRTCVADLLRHRDVERCEIIVRRHGDSVSIDLSTPSASHETTAEGRQRRHVTVPVTGPPADLGSGAAEPESAPHLATRLSSALVVAVLCGFAVQAFIRLFWVTGAVWPIVISTAYLLAALVLQLAYFSRPGTRLHPPMSYLLLALLAALVCLPWLHFQYAWTGLVGLLAGSALLVLRPALGWSLFAAIVATVAWIQLDAGSFLPRLGGNIVTTVVIGVVTYGLTWMARAVRQLRAARQELAEAALAETRLRFARDLHDLLGLSLSAITLKSELAYRLMPANPAKARIHLTEVLEITRHALADVRSVAGGCHEMSLETECRTAETLLVAAGLDVRMDVPDDVDHHLPPDISTVLATVLREGVTNVLRHSKGEHCEITIRNDNDDVRLRIVNDGVTKPGATDHWGRGIHNLSDRVTALHGELTARLEHDGRFGLRARIPLPVPNASGRAVARSSG